nr:spore coat protein SP96 [Drosophila suzukii]
MKVFMLIVVLVALLSPTIVNASCGTCTDSHSCIGESVFQICYDGVRDQTVNYTCPDERPICTVYDIICLANGTDTQRACGDVSSCDVCTATANFACTSLTTFAVCNNGVVSGNDLSCASDYVCSVTGAASGTPCISRCNSTESDICDRVLETDDVVSTTASTGTTASSSSAVTTESPTTASDNSTGSSSVTSSETSSDTTTESTVTTESTGTTPVFNEIVYCQGISSTGRYPITNDTVCTSYIYCIQRSGNWTGLLYNCTAQKPYFDADIYNCGTVKPAYAGCTNLV